MDGLEAHLSEGGQLGHHNSAISRRRFRRAGASGGGREGKPRQSRILRATAASIQKAITLSGLTPATIYGFQVQALGVLGYSDWSATETIMSR